MMLSEVSHPIDVSHETMPGTFWPWTPNAARESTIVGAEPRLPATAMRPQRKKEKVTADRGDDGGLPERNPKPEQERAVADAEHGHVRRKPGPEQVRWFRGALVFGDDVDAAGLNDRRRTGGRRGGVLCIFHEQTVRRTHSRRDSAGCFAGFRGMKLTVGAGRPTRTGGLG